MKEENIWQILTEDERYGIPVLQSWHESQEEAKEELEDCKKFWPNSQFWIEPGTNYIREKCRGCGTVHANECHDAYGITTGFWCDECYDSDKYPYKKDRYDYEAYGERLDDDY